MSILKNFVLAVSFVAATFSAFSQSLTTYSPYSRYGIGEVRNRGYAYTKAMGGISQGIRSNSWVNFLNPASYTAQDSMSFIFDFGIEGVGVNYQSGNQSNFNTSGNIHHVAIKMPITKWMGASAGIQPYSNVGYRLKDVESDPYLLSTIGPIKYYHEGNGGITQAFFGAGFTPFKNFSIGVNMSYLFGSLEYSMETIFPSYTPYNPTKKLNSVVVRDIAFSMGAQYQMLFGADNSYKVTLGATIDNETSIGAQNVVFISYPFGSASDTIYYSEMPKSSIDYPRNVSAGFTLAYKNNFLGGLEFSTQDWRNAKFLNVSDSLTKSQSLRAGVQFTPNPYDLRSYLKRISYRAGFYYTSTFLQLRGNQINDYGITFGVGLPFRRTNTSFNLSYEMGKKGTLNNSLVQETYGVINVGFTFYDFWFVKRKYD